MLFLRFALWLALLFGLAEAFLVAVAAFVLHRYMHVNPQLVWLAPLSFALVFLALTGIFLLGGARLRERFGLRPLAFVLAFIGSLSLFLMLSRLASWAALLLAAGIATQLSAFADRNRSLTQRIMSYTFMPALLLITGMGAGLNGWWALAEWRGVKGLSAARAGAPNIILIIWDTVRASSLGLHGYERPTTPNLERLASRSTVFHNAFATAPWTLPSHAAMFTGALPDALSADWLRPLDTDRPMLAEVLRSRGYRTGGFVANTYYASRGSGLGRGFLRYEDYRVISAQQLVRSTTLGRRVLAERWIAGVLDIDLVLEMKRATEITDAALDWIGRGDEGPFFAFLNYFDAHSPYDPPPPYDRAFGSSLPRPRKLDFGNGEKLTALELQAELDAYDGAIAYLDAELGRFLDALERRGVLENTLVIVTSDHGEEFGEHGVYLHGNSLYDRSLHVPLVIRTPRAMAEDALVRDDWVSLRDLGATVLELARAGANAMPGRSFWRQRAVMVGGGADAIHASVRARPGVEDWYPVSTGDMAVVLMDPWKYIRGGDGTEELYDLRSDRAERNDLARNLPASHILVALRALSVPQTSSGAGPER